MQLLPFFMDLSRINFLQHHDMFSYTIRLLTIDKLDKLCQFKKLFRKLFDQYMCNKLNFI